MRKYRLGRCTKEELAIIERWYYSFDMNEDEKAEFSNTENLDSVREEMFRTITSKINQAEGKREMMGQEATGAAKMCPRIFHHWRRMAAVLAAGAAVGVFLYGQNHKARTETKAVVEKVTAEEILPSTVYLSDGSIVWLKGESRLEYPERFTGNIREVRLTGEAFFDVAKDKSRPFIIYSTHFTTRVLGTTFNIKAYEKDESQEVEVVSGKVIVSVTHPSGKRPQELILKRNQKAIYFKKDNSLVECAGGEDSVFNSIAQWKLVFHEMPLEKIIKVLNAQYDVDISVATESMKNCVITADLADETLEVSIEVLSKAINAKYTMNGKHIVLSGEGCKESSVPD